MIPQEEVDWLSNWLEQRKEQLSNNIQNNESVNKVYKKQIKNASSAKEVNWDEYLNKYAESNRDEYFDKGGLYNNKKHIISYNPKYKNVTDRNNKIHERTHALDALPQYEAIKNILQNNKDYYTKEYGNNILNNYYFKPNEIYSRLMEFRNLNNIDPSLKIDLNYLHKHNNSVISNYLNIFKEEDLLKMLNDVAQNNNTTFDQTLYARKGIKLIPKKKY